MIRRALGMEGRMMSLSVEDLVRKYGDAGRHGVTSNSRVSTANARQLRWCPNTPALAGWFERTAPDESC